MGVQGEMRDFTERIGMAEGARCAVLEFEMDEAEFEGWRTLMAADEDAFFDRLERESDWKLRCLYLFVRFGMLARQAYLDAGADECCDRTPRVSESVWQIGPQLFAAQVGIQVQQRRIRS